MVKKKHQNQHNLDQLRRSSASETSAMGSKGSKFGATPRRDATRPTVLKPDPNRSRVKPGEPTAQRPRRLRPKELVVRLHLRSVVQVCTSTIKHVFLDDLKNV